VKWRASRWRNEPSSTGIRDARTARLRAGRAPRPAIEVALMERNDVARIAGAERFDRASGIRRLG
jgi:hypothetical protein